MRGLPAVDPGPQVRVRRWDAVVLGGALPGLVAAARLGMRGKRVLVLEEAAAAQRAACLREPFFFGGIDKHAVLGACLRALKVPLIDQRRIVRDPIAFQVVLPDARVEIGEPALSADEWVAWGLAKPELARTLTGALHEAGLAERDALLEDPIVCVRGTRRTPESPLEPAAQTPRQRGLPRALADAPERVQTVLAAWTRALSNLGGAAPGDAARARLLGAPFEGSADARGAGAVQHVLRRRIESLYGEFRTLPGPFRLLSAGGQPGLAPDANGESGEVWVGRALVLNAPLDALAGAVAQEPPPLLKREPAAWRRLELHWRAPRAIVPEAMAPRVVLVGDESAPLRGTNLVTLRASSAENGLVDLVAAAVIPADAPAAQAEAEMEARIATLLPFAEGRLERSAEPEPRWDDAARLADPPGAGGWPSPSELRLDTKQPVYALERASIAGLGSEGDLLLGWRGGDAIAADLG